MSRAEKITYSIIIPVFNSSQNLPVLHSGIQRVFHGKIKESFEIIFVDDGSSNPRTWPALEKLHHENSNIKIIQLSRNFGQHAATLCGIEEAGGEYILTMDDDMEHSPEDIPELIKENEHDVVIAKFGKNRHTLHRRILSRIKGRFDTMIIGKPKNIQLTTFRLIKRQIAKGILTIKTPYPLVSAALFFLTRDIVNVEVNQGKRWNGRSGYNLVKLVKIFSNLLINNSAFLLRFIGILGIMISFLSSITGIYLLIRRFIFKIYVVGWTSLITAVLFIGGILLFSVGIIGEYLIRIIETSERKPTYFIKKRMG